MKNQIILYLGFLVLFVAGCSSSRESDWALRDAAYIHSAIIENHPGIYNQLDPDFKINLEANYVRVKNQLSLSNNDAEKIAAIKLFIRSFNDAHMYINYNENNVQQAKNTDAVSAAKQFNVELLDNDIHWITLPTFQPKETQQKSLQNIIDSMPQFRSHKLIVFDIRGNGGGNSEWARALVMSLFGQEHARDAFSKNNENISVDWRASEGNLEHMRDLQAKNAGTFEPQSSFMQWLCQTIEGMQAALAAGLPYFTERNDQEKLQRDTVDHEDLVKAHIVVIIDDRCVSAALDFIDYLKAMNHPVTLIGKTTKADSLYMECRTFDLPSKKGTFFLPIKVYRNRVRGHNEPYVPDIVFSGDMTDAKALQDFVLKKFDFF